MINPRVQDEGLYIVNIAIQIPNLDTPLIIPLKLTPENFEKTRLTVQALHREGSDIFDYQQTQDLKTLAGRPINRRLTGSAVQSEWRI